LFKEKKKTTNQTHTRNSLLIWKEVPKCLKKLASLFHRFAFCYPTWIPLSSLPPDEGRKETLTVTLVLDKAFYKERMAPGPIARTLGTHTCRLNILETEESQNSPLTAVD